MIQYKNNQITVFQSVLYMTTSTVVATDDLVLVVDPTWLPQEVIAIRNYVESIRGNRPVYLLFTHSDFDHILGYKAIRDATTIASKEFTEHPDKENVLEQIRSFDDRYYLQRDYHLEYPTIDYIVHEDGQKLVVGKTELTFYKAPGHTFEGMITFVEPLGVMIAGDYLSDIEFPYIYYSSIEYEKTLMKAKKLISERKAKILIPGHGRTTDLPEEMNQRVDDAFSYIRNLRTALVHNEGDQINKLIENRPFLRKLRSYHLSNQELIKRELNLSD